MSIREPYVFFRVLLAVVFCIVILLPGAMMLYGDKQIFSQTEKRLLKEFPPYPGSIGEVSEFIQNITVYLNDHFGLREFFVHRYQREVRKRFDVIGDEIYVLKGLDNYYYYTRAGVLDDFLGRQVVSKGDLQQWVEHYKEKKKWLSEKGIQYLMIAVPSKYAIYPEYVAKDWEKIRGESRLQQLNKYLAGVGGFSFVDLTGRLIKEKNSEFLFHKSDTHWTPYGAYLGYLGIAEEVERKIPALSFKKNFSFSREVSRDCDPDGNRCGDLTKMLLDFEPFTEPYKAADKYAICSQKQTLSLSLSNLERDDPEQKHFETYCPGKDYTAVVFHDSFFISIKPFFSENFGRVVYLWKYFDQKNIEEILEIFKPDIVVEERAERFLF